MSDPRFYPIRLGVEGVPEVTVRQQPHPLEADDPDHWITTIEIGPHTAQVQVVVNTPTAVEGIDAVCELAGAMWRQAMTQRSAEWGGTIADPLVAEQAADAEFIDHLRSIAKENAAEVADESRAAEAA